MFLTFMKFDLFEVWSVLESWWLTLVDFILSGLPLSPVDTFIGYIQSFPYLGWLNWFIPVGTCVRIMAGWLACVGSYYLVSILLRFLKVIR